MTTDCDHCWHRAPIQHAIYRPGHVHIDQVCCHCGEKRCRDIPVPGTYNVDDHGPYDPVKGRVYYEGSNT